jgi:transcription elongation factor Elf1
MSLSGSHLRAILIPVDDSGRDAMTKLCRRCGNPGVFRMTTRRGKKYELTVCNSCTAAYAREYRESHPEVKVYARNYMRSYRKPYREKNPVKSHGSREWRKANPEKHLWDAMKNRVRSKERRPINMTFAEFLEEIGGRIPPVCPVLGIPIGVGLGPFCDNSASVDRIDNDKPYEKGNIAVISMRANTIKRNGTAEEHRRIADWMDSVSPHHGQ